MQNISLILPHVEHSLKALREELSLGEGWRKKIIVARSAVLGLQFRKKYCAVFRGAAGAGDGRDLALKGGRWFYSRAPTRIGGKYQPSPVALWERPSSDEEEPRGVTARLPPPPRTRLLEECRTVACGAKG
eukprot:CAMPEP_0194339154 /NCGR_PEP_ID=MMETSP0171-20130528/82027_1 /TAXON_ID=218684 /ORGANISM="Corethron pennatum, Strain L29A3" /LENGTH=130 /DNA_ID=CAMNT_0039103565 /DNA_START=39 /DNA_END=431 /DNA_ORIENTATION=-